MRSTRRVGGQLQPLLIRPCSRWGLPGRHVSIPPVRSYRTISPLPQAAVLFLWHFPSGCPARTLSGIAPCGARTFLCAAIACHTATTQPPDPPFYHRILRAKREKQREKYGKSGSDLPVIAAQSGREFVSVKSYRTCIVSFMGSLFGLLVVHVTSFTMALNNKTTHVSRHDAFWDAVFYDFMVGIPIAGLCGWAVASALRLRQPPPNAEES